MRKALLRETYQTLFIQNLDNQYATGNIPFSGIRFLVIRDMH